MNYDTKRKEALKLMHARDDRPVSTATIELEQLKDMIFMYVLAEDITRKKRMVVYTSFRPSLRSGHHVVHESWGMVQVHDDKQSPSCVYETRGLESAITAYNKL